MVIAEQINPALESIPAGGIDPNCFEVKEAWYPVFYLEDLDRNKLHTFTLLGINLVIWWDNSTQSWRVFEDKCPHRLAPLSEGRVNQEGLLECPYHGWTFSGTGKCEAIPQQLPGGKAETSQRACANALPCTSAQGLLFVYPGKPENAFKVKVPLIDVLEQSSNQWVCLNTFRDLPYDAFTLLENVLDSSHIPYTHHRTVGNRANVAPVELEIVESGQGGFQGLWTEGPRKGTLGKQDTFFIAPNLMWHDLTSKQFGRTLTVVYATPIRKGECRLFARFPFKFSSRFPALVMKLTPRWYSHLNQNRVLEDDQIFLHHQERYLEEAGGSENFTKAFYLPTKADLFVFEFRQWVNQYCSEAFSEQNLSPAWTTEQLLDRYHSHTSKCSNCSQALKNIQKLRKLAVLIAIIASAIAPVLSLKQPSVWSMFPISVTILLCSATWWQLGKLARKLIRGEAIPPRNL